MQWKDKARAAEAEVQKLQSQLAHVEHASRAQELNLEQLKGRLSDKVTREERLARRDAEAYARLKRAFLSNKGMNPPMCGSSFLQHARCVDVCSVSNTKNSFMSLSIGDRGGKVSAVTSRYGRLHGLSEARFCCYTARWSSLP